MYMRPNDSLHYHRIHIVLYITYMIVYGLVAPPTSANVNTLPQNIVYSPIRSYDNRI